MPEATKLPSVIGEVAFSDHGITAHCADSRRFDPVAYSGWSTPQEGEAAPLPLPLAPQVPITLIPDTKFIPQNYVVHTSFQRCLHCNTVHESSTVYAFNNIPARMGMKSIMHLVPVSRFSYNVPIVVQRLPETTTPCCHECARSSLDLSHLPKPASAEAFKQLVNTKYTDAPLKSASANGKKKAEPKQPLTIDDVL